MTFLRLWSPCMLLIWLSVFQPLYGASLGSGGLEELLAGFARETEEHSINSGLFPWDAQASTGSSVDAGLPDLRETSTYLARQEPPKPPPRRPPKRTRLEEPRDPFESLSGGVEPPSSESIRSARALAGTTTSELVPELTLEQREAALRQVRTALYVASQIRIWKKIVRPVVPFTVNLEPRTFEVVVANLMLKPKPPWLFTSEGKRFLLRKESLRSGLFKDTYGFGPETDRNRVYFSVWQEIGSGSNVWQLLGLIRPPFWKTFKKYVARVLDKTVYPVPNYRVLSSSSFAANPQAGTR